VIASLRKRGEFGGGPTGNVPHHPAQGLHQGQGAAPRWARGRGRPLAETDGGSRSSRAARSGPKWC
jgi:hypothetical protein